MPYTVLWYPDCLSGTGACRFRQSPCQACPPHSSQRSCQYRNLLRRDADRTSSRVAKVLRKVSDLELIQAPNLPYTLPREYRSLPHLTGAYVHASPLLPAYFCVGVRGQSHTTRRFQVSIEGPSWCRSSVSTIMLPGFACLQTDLCKCQGRRGNAACPSVQDHALACSAPTGAAGMISLSILAMFLGSHLYGHAHVWGTAYRQSVCLQAERLWS